MNTKESQLLCPLLSHLFLTQSEEPPSNAVPREMCSVQSPTGHLLRLSKPQYITGKWIPPEWRCAAWPATLSPSTAAARSI